MEESSGPGRRRRRTDYRFREYVPCMEHIFPVDKRTSHIPLIRHECPGCDTGDACPGLCALAWREPVACRSSRCQSRILLCRPQRGSPKLPDRYLQPCPPVVLRPLAVRAGMARGGAATRAHRRPWRRRHGRSGRLMGWQERRSHRARPGTPGSPIRLTDGLAGRRSVRGALEIDRPVAAPNRDIRNSTIRVRVGAPGNKTEIRRQLR